MSDTHISSKPRSILRAFPVPKFLAMPATGFDISDTFVRHISLRQVSNGHEVDSYGETSIPAGLIDAGYVNNKEELSSIFAGIKKKYGMRFVRVSLPEERSYIFRTMLSKEELVDKRASIEKKIQENVPITPAKAVFDYRILPSLGALSTEGLEMSVTVVQKGVIEAYTEILYNAGLIPLLYKVESQAISDAVIPRGLNRTYLVVNFSDTKSGFFIVKDGVVQFASTVAIGGNSLTALIQKHFNLSFAEAVELKRRKDFSKSQENTEILDTLANSFSVIKDEINKLFGYWETHNNQSGTNDLIEKVVLVGEDAMLAGVDKYIALNVSVPVEIGNVWVNTCSFESYIPPIHRVLSLNYSAAIGLALNV